MRLLAWAVLGLAFGAVARWLDPSEGPRFWSVFASLWVANLIGFAEGVLRGRAL